MIRLSERERKILAAIQFRADASVQEIAKLSGCREHTVRYTINKLKDNGTIRSILFTDVYRFGFAQFAAYFNLASSAAKNKNQLLSALQLSNRVSWIRPLSGDYHYGIAICCSKISEVADFFDELSESFGNIFFEKAISARVNMTRFQMKYLSPGIKNCQYISCGNARDTVALDRTDHQILSLLTANPELSRPAAAMKLGIARTTLDNRISKLRKNGVIVGFVNQTDIAKLGMQHAILLVYARGVGRAFRKSLFEFSRNHLYIDSLFQCVGNWEYEIGVEIPNAQAIIEITQELYTTFPREINAIKMLSCFEALKMSLYPFNQHFLPGTELT